MGDKRINQLKLSFCTYNAAEYAVKRWHYSKSMPTGKTIKIGVWENNIFTGVVIFSRGATPHIGSPYGLDQTEVCELTRVALNAHQTPVSRIVALAIKLLQKKCPGVKLVVSYADTDQGHTGAIYQAGNWIYEGLMNAGARGAFIVNGKKTHPRSIGAMGGTQSIEWVRQNLDPNATEFFTRGKHKYLMPLHDDIRTQITQLAKPYPKGIL